MLQWSQSYNFTFVKLFCVPSSPVSWNFTPLVVDIFGTVNFVHDRSVRKFPKAGFLLFSCWTRERRAINTPSAFPDIHSLRGTHHVRTRTWAISRFHGNWYATMSASILSPTSRSSWRSPTLPRQEYDPAQSFAYTSAYSGAATSAFEASTVSYSLHHVSDRLPRRTYGTKPTPISACVTILSVEHSLHISSLVCSSLAAENILFYLKRTNVPP